MTERIFDEAGRAAFAKLYPEEAGVVTHRLVGHPLFELEALVRLADRMRPADVERNLGDLPIGVDPDAVRGNGLSVADTIRSIEDNGSWMVLKFVEQDPEYSALLDTVLGEIAPLVAMGEEVLGSGDAPRALGIFQQLFDMTHDAPKELRGDVVSGLVRASVAAGAVDEAPVINAGAPTTSTGLTTDVDGAPRVQGGKIDIGPFEFG